MNIPNAYPSSTEPLVVVSACAFVLISEGTEKEEEEEDDDDDEEEFIGPTL
jgi:hypothetical protein